MNADMLNHCSSAIPDLYLMASKIGHFDDARALVWAAQQLQGAQKFLLPEGGRVIDDPASIARVMDQMRLPFPVVAMEYRVEGTIDFQREVSAKRRIALAMEWPAFVESFCQALSLPQSHFDAQVRSKNRSDNSIVVASVYKADAHDIWVLAPFLEVLHPDSDIKMVHVTKDDLSEGATHTEDGRTIYLHPDRVKPGKKHTWEADLLRLLPHLAGKFMATLGPDEGPRAAMLDLADEVIATASLAAVTACANVKQEIVRAPDALNKKRTKSGKPPLFDYRTLVLDASPVGYVDRGARPSGAAGGGHASPREHVRRGHVRRLGESRTTWVNNALVNPGHPGGSVVHGYKLRRAA